MKAGDHIILGSAHAGDAERRGEILEVIETYDWTHYRVRWADGHETLFFPASGASIRVERASHKKSKTSAA